MNITGQTPLQTLRLEIVPWRYQILGPASKEIRFFSSLTNRWNKTRQFIFDLEIMQNIVGGTIGIGKNSEIGISIPFLTYNSRFLDEVIIEYHSYLGIDLVDRNKYPTNASMVSILDENGENQIVFDGSDLGTVLGDISLTGRILVYRGESWIREVILTGLIRLPTASEREYYGSGGADIAASISASYLFGPFILYSTLGYGYSGPGQLFGFELREYQWTSFTCLELPVFRNYSLIVQQLSNSGIARDFSQFSQPTHELVVGVKQFVSQQVMIEYGITENVFEYKNSVDFGLNFGLTWLP